MATKAKKKKNSNSKEEPIEKDNPSLKDVLPKVYARQNLDPTNLGGLIDLVGNITLGNAKAGSSDVLGHVFEYFLGEFALAEGKKGGQFYTPKSVVELLVEMLEPYKGRVFNPCCGSGGMFVQSEKFVADHQGKVNDISIYGQESNQTTWCLNEQVKRNIERFPVEFCFQLTSKENEYLRSQIATSKAPSLKSQNATSNTNRGGRRYLPYAFTEQGVAMLSGVLRTEFGNKNTRAVQYTEDPKRLSDIDDILFCVRGSTTGKMNWADVRYAIGRGIAAIGVNEGPKYKHFIRGIIDYNLPGLLASATGSTFPNVSRSQLEDLVILIPPPTEQKAIASVLSSLDDKIDLLHRQNKTLEAMAETHYRQWFVEEAKADWEDGCLEDIVDINPTYQLKSRAFAPYLEMSNVSNSTFNPEGWHMREFTSGMKFQNGDTLLARITPCLENRKTCFVAFLKDKEIGWGSTEYIVMRMKKPFHPFISYILAKDKDFRDFAIGSMTGSSGR